MISKRSMPVNSFSATDSIGTWVMVNTKVNTVRPSAIEIGMPVSMSAMSRPKMIAEVIAQRLPARAPRMEVVLRQRRWTRDVLVGDLLDARHLGRVVMRQFARAHEVPRHLQEAKAHQSRPAGNGQVDDPHRQFHVGRGLVGVGELPDEAGAERGHHAGKQRAGEQAEEDAVRRRARSGR